MTIKLRRTNKYNSNKNILLIPKTLFVKDDSDVSNDEVILLLLCNDETYLKGDEKNMKYLLGIVSIYVNYWLNDFKLFHVH